MNGSHSGSAALQVDHLILQGEASAEEMRGSSEGAATRSRTTWDKVWQERPFDWLALRCLLSSAGVPVCVVPGVMGGGDSDRKFFLIVRTKRCRLTDRLAGWLTCRLTGWLTGCATDPVNALQSKIIRPGSRLDGLDNYWLFDGWRLQTVIRLGSGEFGWCGGGVAQTLCANVLLTRLKQHDHPLSFLSCILQSASRGNLLETLSKRLQMFKNNLHRKRCE